MAFGPDVQRILIGGIVSLLASACTSRSSDGSPSFVGKIWISTDASAAPGTLRIFLSDGTMVMDSCGETYRLALWRTIERNRMAWQEDSAEIEAEILQDTPDALELRLYLVNEAKQEHYQLARVPYVCPDSRPNPRASIGP